MPLSAQGASLISLGIQETIPLIEALIARHQAAGIPLPPADQIASQLRADATAQLNAENAYLVAHGEPPVTTATVPAPLPSKKA